MAQGSTVEVALAHAQSLLQTEPGLAQSQAEAILQAVPGHPPALLLLAAARRRRGDPEAACRILEPLAEAQPGAAVAHHELALALAALERPRPALAALRRALELKPRLAGGWRLLGDLLYQLGDGPGADAAYGRHLDAATSDPELMLAAHALVAGDLATAERLLRARLAEHRTDVAALRLLAELATRLGRYEQAQAMLEDCVARAPGFVLARHNLAVVLFRQGEAQAAMGHIDQLLAADPRNPNYRSLSAACLALLAEYDRSVEVYQPLLAEFPEQPKVWLSYGHALKTAGHRDRAIEAYRTAFAQSPNLGEAYWSLANMKGAVITADEVQTAGRQLEHPDLAAEDRYHFHYALGHALEQAGDYPASFQHYAAGARLRRAEIDYDAAKTTARLRRMRKLMTAGFFAERAGVGCTDEAPIFIVGLPRSGSTLIEQILSSHSEVEGTMELSEVADIARDLGGADAAADAYPERLAELDADAFEALGRRFLDRTRIYRKTDRPIFIDKMPNNFVHVGLIHLMLPRARIIDARRDPMAAGFSAFKQHFARGQHFSYDLRELGLYYRDYVALMDHFDRVLPGRVHRMRYEEVVDDLEGQTRRALDYCGLDFQEDCLRFHENSRAVRTASSEQVRRPIYRDGLDQWRNFAPWLEPLAKALEEKDPGLDGPPPPSSQALQSQETAMSQPPVIAVIAAGEMGAGLGGRLAQDGARVLTSLAGRSENSRRRAAEAGMIDAPDEELAAADLIISLVPPIQALALAERLAPGIAKAGRAPLYADANAVSPDTVRAIAAVVEAAGARMVDAGVIGLAPRPGYQPTVYASGSYAPDFKALTSPALDVRLLDGPVGQASALKLSYSAINKGTFALVAAAILGACEAGVGAELDAQLASSQPGVRDYLQKRMPGLFPKAYRWDAEMREIAAFLGGPASHIYEGAAQMFDRLATDHAGAKADETAILTFLRGGTDKA